MVEALARTITHRPIAWAIVVFTVIFAAVCSVLAFDVEQDDDVLAFLPATNTAIPDINARFGATDVTLVRIGGATRRATAS